MLLGIYASKGEWRQALLHVPPILAFAMGVFVTVTISFVASVQATSFRKLVDSPYTTTMSICDVILFNIGEGKNSHELA